MSTDSRNRATRGTIAILTAAMTIIWLLISLIIVKDTGQMISALGALILLVMGIFEYNERRSTGETNDMLRQTADSISMISASNKLVEKHRSILEGRHPKLFGGFALDRIEQLAGEFGEMTTANPRYTIRAVDPSMQYVDIFVKVMQKHITEGAHFDVVTNTSVIWSSQNFGRRGNRYLRANKLAESERGVKIRRLFVVSREELLDSAQRARVTKILEQHQKVMFADLSMQRSSTRPGGCELRVLLMTDNDRYQAHFSSGSNFALTKADDREICIQVHYDQSRIDISGNSENVWILGGFVIDTDFYFIKEKGITFQLMWNDPDALANGIEKDTNVEEILDNLRIRLESPSPSNERAGPNPNDPL